MPGRTQRWTSLAALTLLPFACTLTSDDYEPQRLEAAAEEVTAQAEPAPAPATVSAAAQPSPLRPPAPPPDGQTSASCTSSAELPGCQLEQQGPSSGGAECRSELDCASRHCSDGRCVPASCLDGILNQDESDTDCAGPCQARCGEAARCSSSADCESGLTCLGATGRCAQPSCTDGELNGDETARDCGGGCGACPAGSACSRAQDCDSGLCSAGACAAASCADLLRNQDETDTDCGGVCAACGPGQACSRDEDCQSGACQDGACCGGSEVDCTRCARRLASTLSCASNGASAEDAAACDGFLQCLAEHPQSCPRRQTPGCASAGAVCDVASYGGTSSQAIARADAIIGTAACSF